MSNSWVTDTAALDVGGGGGGPFIRFSSRDGNFGLKVSRDEPAITAPRLRFVADLASLKAGYLSFAGAGADSAIVGTVRGSPPAGVTEDKWGAEVQLSFPFASRWAGEEWAAGAIPAQPLRTTSKLIISAFSALRDEARAEARSAGAGGYSQFAVVDCHKWQAEKVGSGTFFKPVFSLVGFADPADLSQPVPGTVWRRSAPAVEPVTGGRSRMSAPAGARAHPQQTPEEDFGGL